MKLQRLYIEKYRVLQDLNIKFNASDEHPVALARRPGYALDFLVGVNGTGKSTVLQILSDLMQRLEHCAKAPIPYLFELEYELDEGKQKRRMKVSNLPDEEEEETEYVVPVKVWENGEQVSLSNSLLPKQIIAYTTGSEEEWKKLGKGIVESTSALDAFQIFSSENSLELDVSLPEKPDILPFVEEQVNEEQRFVLIQSHQLDKVILLL